MAASNTQLQARNIEQEQLQRLVKRYDETGANISMQDFERMKQLLDKNGVPQGNAQQASAMCGHATGSLSGGNGLSGTGTRRKEDDEDEGLSKLVVIDHLAYYM